MLALLARGPARFLAGNGFIALVAMLAVYIGARLVNGSFVAIVTEMAAATFIVIAVRLAMDRWMPIIGIAILLHGVYDAIVGPHTGVAEWYPPLCSGFDIVVGLGLLLILSRRANDGQAA